MKEYVIDIEAENKEIRKRYRDLLRACKPTLQTRRQTRDT